MTWSVRPILLASCCVFTLAAAAPAREADAPSPAQQAAVRAYIKDGWTTLSRSTRDLAKAAPDPKFPRPPEKPWPVYVPAAEDLARVEAELRTTLSPEDRSKIEL